MTNQEESDFDGRDHLWEEFHHAERRLGDPFDDLVPGCEVHRLADDLIRNERLAQERAHADRDRTVEAEELHLLKRFHGKFRNSRDVQNTPPGKAVRATFVEMREEHDDRPELVELLEKIQKTYLDDLERGYLGTG